MSSSVTNASKKLRHLPQLLAECSSEAAAYSRCVAIQENLKQNDCITEFTALKNCISHKAKKIIK